MNGCGVFLVMVLVLLGLQVCVLILVEWVECVCFDSVCDVCSLCIEMGVGFGLYGVWGGYVLVGMLLDYIMGCDLLWVYQDCVLCCFGQMFMVLFYD